MSQKTEPQIKTSARILNLKSKLLIIPSLVSAVLFSACANTTNPIADVVKNITVKAYQVDSDNWVQMTANLSTGGFMFAAINVPIVDPKDNTKIYGQVALAPNMCTIGGTCEGGGDLTVSVNLTQAAKLHTTDTLLPNGAPIPIGGLQNVQLIALPISNTNGKVYVALAPGAAMIGAAVPFSQLDPAGKYVPGLAIFQPFQINSVNIIAGVFAGSAPKTTGVGVFADVSHLINQNPALLADGSQPKLEFKEVRGSAKDEAKFFKKIYKLYKKGTLLTLE